MKTFSQLVIARNKEFYRDKGSLAWAFILPVLIIVGCAFAFSGEKDSLLTVGFYPDTAEFSQPESLAENYTQWIGYDNLSTAEQRLRHHQIHALINLEDNSLWLNPESSQGQLIQQLFKHNNEYNIETLSGRSIRYVDWVLPGVLGMNIMFASLFGVGYVLVRYRKNGVLKRLQATPITPLKFLSAQVASRFFIVISTNAAIFVGAWLILDLVFLGKALDLLIVASLGTITMISLALLMASRTSSEELAGGLLNAATWPMMFLSGIWFSLDDTPDYVQTIANVFPLTHLVDAARGIMINGATLWDVWPQILAMLITSLVCLLLAASLFRWNKP